MASSVRSLVLPWRWVAGLFVVGTAIGAGITRLAKGTWAPFFEPEFLLFSAAGWFGCALLLRLLAGPPVRDVEDDP